MFKRTVLALALAALPFRASALENEDLLALVAMPLAVAAVSEVTDVPMSDLIDVVTLLNDANVPPVQFVEVVRYAPLALVVDTEPDFDDLLRAQIAGGVQGVALVPFIEQHYLDLGLRDIDLDTPRVVTVVDQPFVPEIVTTRLAAVRAHPHGGPPGQLKKAAGVQTGAEIVHGARPGRGNTARVRDNRDDGDDDRVVARRTEPRKVKVDRENRPKIENKGRSDTVTRGHGGGEGRGHGGDKHGDQGGGSGKGHGKGKGKG